MGMTRKLMSVSTGGLVDFRSDKERIARKTAKGARAAKKQNKLMDEQNKLIEQQTAAIQAQTAAAVSAPPVAAAATPPTPPPPPVPAGWYPDPNGAPLQRYWDGSAWTENTAPAAPAAP